MKVINTQTTMQNKISEYVVANKKLLNKLGLIMTPTLVFPTAKVSFMSKIAIKVLNRAGGRMDFNFTKA